MVITAAGNAMEVISEEVVVDLINERQRTIGMVHPVNMNSVAVEETDPIPEEDVVIKEAGLIKDQEAVKEGEVVVEEGRDCDNCEIYCAILLWRKLFNLT